MSKEIHLIDEKIEALIYDKKEYNFQSLKEKIELILKNELMFMIGEELNTKAVDLYIKKVISQKNKLKKQEEEKKLINLKEEKYFLLECICNKYDFQKQEELIKKIDELKNKTILELKEINSSL